MSELADSVLEASEGAVRVATATAMSMTVGLVSLEDVVLAGPDGLGGQEVVELVRQRRLLRPPAHRLEHFPLDLDIVVADGRVVERPQDVIDDFIDGDAGVLPSEEDTTIFFLR